MRSSITIRTVDGGLLQVASVSTLGQAGECQSRHQLQSTGGMRAGGQRLGDYLAVEELLLERGPTARARTLARQGPRAARWPRQSLLSVYGVVLGGTICTLCDARFLGVWHALFWKRLLLVREA